MSKAILDSVETVSTEDLELNWHEAPRGWGHSMHTLAPYVGGYPPALARYFIERFSNKGDTVLDPFCGGGTTPLEAGICGRKAFANDTFGYAHTLTSAKCNALSPAEFDSYLTEVLDEMEDIPEEALTLNNEDVSVFYSEATLNDILRMKSILSDRESDDATFLKGLICGILHGPSEMYLSVQTKDTFSGSVDYVRDYIEEHNLEVPDRDIEKCARNKYERATEDGVPSIESQVTGTDSRDLAFPDESVDFVLTSPPYMHVLDYTWNNWIRLWWLGKDRLNEKDEMEVTADVERYQNFINKSLQQLYRVLKPDSRAVVVIGDVKKHRSKGTYVVHTGQIIAEQAMDVGFDVDHVIDDTYNVDKRSYVRFNDLRHDNAETYMEDSEELLERCIVLNKGSPATDNTVSAPW